MFRNELQKGQYNNEDGFSEKHKAIGKIKI